jgi:hypothetical protein
MRANRARVDHHPGAISSFFSHLPHGSPVALESVGNWNWIADEIETAGCRPLLTNPAKAKLLIGHVNKTDKLDANGLATLLQLGSLPSVWLPTASLRDQRELPRFRMALCAMQTSLKNRIHSFLAKYALSPDKRLPAVLPTGTYLAEHKPLPSAPVNRPLCLPTRGAAGLPQPSDHRARGSYSRPDRPDSHYAVVEKPSRGR